MIRPENIPKNIWTTFSKDQKIAVTQALSKPKAHKIVKPMKIKKLNKISITEQSINKEMYIIKKLKQITNKRNEIQQQNFRITNEKKQIGISFDNISKYYKKLIESGKNPKDIVITAKNLYGNWKTLKSKNYDGKVLKYDDQDNDYFSSMPVEISDELKSNYYSVDVIIYLIFSILFKNILK